MRIGCANPHWEVEAIGLKDRCPDLSDQEIAGAVGVTPATLAGSKAYTDFRDLLREIGKEEILRGYRIQGSNPSQPRDVEAVMPPRDFDTD